ncbi:RNI-like protein [Lichtheimia hyalospora FSU 10163]|nr:RNI-like protein [Lichtheimia hyalospora FSU 10163]
MSSWEIFSNKAVKARNEGNDEQAIHYMTKALHEMKRTLLFSMLDNRAVVYMRTSQYELAFNDAKEMMQQIPKEEAGYLRAAKVYEAQSRLAEALDIYELGLVHINDSETLKERKLLVEEQLQQRVDWVSLLPADVLALIMAELSIYDCRACTQVSRQWRDKLLSCMYIKCKHAQLDRYGNTAPFLGRHVQSLELKHHQDNRMMKLVNVCSNLRTLVINECFISIEDILPALESVGHNLQQLALCIHPMNDPLPLDPILRACPQLTAFSYHAPCHTFSRNGSFPELSLQTRNANYPNLEFLSWDVDQRIMPLPTVLKHFPHLRSLTIPHRLRENGGQQIELDIISSHCPDLEYLSFSHGLLESNDPILPTGTLAYTKGHGHLKEFRFGDLEGYDGVDMVNLLKTCQDHIETVRLGGHARPGNPMGRWDELPFLRCAQLRTLELTIACETDELVRFLQHTPSLEQVTFNGMTQLRNSVLYVLQQRTNLKHVAFYECNGFSEAGMCEFFGTTQAKFEHVTLEKCGGMTNRTLEALGSTHGASLKSLQIAYEGQMEQEGLLDLASNLQVLEKFTIKHIMMAFTDHVMNALGDLPSLAELYVTDCLAVTDLGVRSLIDKNKLQYLSLTRCMHIGFETMEYARHVLGRNNVFDGYNVY